MPTYDFLNTETGETEEKFMSISDREKFLKENPHMQQVIGSPNLITGVDGSVLKKAGDGWKEVQQRIQSGLPPKDRGRINTK